MPLGHYTWRGAETRYLTAFAYEEITITSSLTGFNQTLVALSEFGMVRFTNGPFRAIWTPTAASVLTNSFGVIFYDNTYDVFNREEMRFFLATLQSGASSGLLAVHYYSAPTT